MVIILSIAHLAHSEKLALRHDGPGLSRDERSMFNDTVRRLKSQAMLPNALGKPSWRPDSATVVIPDGVGGCAPSGEGPDDDPETLDRSIAFDGGSQGGVSQFHAFLSSGVGSMPGSHKTQVNARLGSTGHPPAAQSPSGANYWASSPSHTVAPPDSNHGTGPSSSSPPPGALSAWTLTAVPNTFGYDCGVEPLPLPQRLIRQHVREHRAVAASLAAQLARLNPLQQARVLAHARHAPGELLAVGELARRPLPTVLGTVEMAVLLWVTGTPEDGPEHAATGRRRDPRVEREALSAAPPPGFRDFERTRKPYAGPSRADDSDSTSPSATPIERERWPRADHAPLRSERHDALGEARHRISVASLPLPRSDNATPTAADESDTTDATSDAIVVVEQPRQRRLLSERPATEARRRDEEREARRRVREREEERAERARQRAEGALVEAEPRRKEHGRRPAREERPRITAVAYDDDNRRRNEYAYDLDGRAARREDAAPAAARWERARREEAQREERRAQRMAMEGVRVKDGHRGREEAAPRARDGGLDADVADLMAAWTTAYD